MNLLFACSYLYDIGNIVKCIRNREGERNKPNTQSGKNPRGVGDKFKESALFCRSRRLKISQAPIFPNQDKILVGNGKEKSCIYFFFKSHCTV